VARDAGINALVELSACVPKSLIRFSRRGVLRGSDLLKVKFQERTLLPSQESQQPSSSAWM